MFLLISWPCCLYVSLLIFSCCASVLEGIGQDEALCHPTPFCLSSFILFSLNFRCSKTSSILIRFLTLDKKRLGDIFSFFLVCDICVFLLLFLLFLLFCLTRFYHLRGRWFLAAFLFWLLLLLSGCCASVSHFGFDYCLSGVVFLLWLLQCCNGNVAILLQWLLLRLLLLLLRWPLLLLLLLLLFVCFFYFVSAPVQNAAELC